MAKCICFIDYQDEQSSIVYTELLKSEKEFIYFKYLAWDSDFFGKDSFLLDISKSKFTPSEEVRLQIKDKFKECFITVKLDTKIDYFMGFFLQECGFYYVDTEIKLQNIQICANIVSDNIVFEELFDSSALPFEDIGRAFSVTRFHCDPNIENKKADELWISYVKNFKSSENKRIFIAKVDNEIAGVILVNITNGEAFLFFVAVLENFRSKKIGSALIQGTIKSIGKGVKIYTGTQVKNVSALNFYLRNGFQKIVQTSTVLHYWH